MLDCPHCYKANWKCNVRLNKWTLFKIALAFYRGYFKERVKVSLLVPNVSMDNIQQCRGQRVGRDLRFDVLF